MSNDREYLDIKIFVDETQRDGSTKRRPMNIGYAWIDDKGQTRFKLTSQPMPGVKTEWGGVIEKRGARAGGGSSAGHGGNGDDGSDIPF